MTISSAPDAFDTFGDDRSGKERLSPKRAQYCISHRECRGRITRAQIGGDLCKVARRAV